MVHAMRLPRWLTLVSAAGVSCGSPSGVHAPGQTARATELLAPSPPAAPDPARELASKVDAIFSSQSRSGVPGCAVGVYRAGQVLFSHGYGLANLEHGVPIKTNSVFDIASISKQFTAMAILLLEREGKLSLDDDIRKYVPEIPDYGRPIRLHHLLHHTSGLRDYVPLLDLAGLENDVVTDDDLLFVLHQQKALNFPTGTDWQYSNSGYFLLAVAVKRVTGMKFSAFAKERIFGPLGMKNTLILDDHTAVVRGRATGYVLRKDGNGFRTAISRWEHAGASRVATTIDDLARWDANFYDPRVGDRAMIERLRTPGKLDDGKPLNYALGLYEETVNGRHVEQHTGGTGGYVSDLIRYPTERLTVACLCNVESDPDTNPPDLAPAVAELFLPASPVTEVSETHDAGVADAAPSEKPKYVASAAELAELAGSYYDPSTFIVRTLAPRDGRVLVSAQLEPGGPTRVYTPEGPRTLTVPGQSMRLVFEPATRSSPAHIIRTVEHEHPVQLVRFEPATLSPSALAEYAGRYASDEFSRDLRLVVVGGKLRSATWGRTLDVDPFTTLARDLFKSEEWGIQFERDRRGRIRDFLISGEGFRGIRFVRR